MGKFIRKLKSNRWYTPTLLGLKIGMIKLKKNINPKNNLFTPRIEARINEIGAGFRAMLIDSHGKSIVKDLISLRKAKSWANSKIKEAKHNDWSL